MKRLPLGKVQDALTNPVAFRAQLDAAAAGGFGPTYMNTLRQAIHHYHANPDPAAAVQYLETRLAESIRLKSPSRRATTVDQLEWYLEQYQTCGGVSFAAPLRLSVPVPRRARDEIKCTGEISRLDLVANGGYAAWLFVSALDPNWLDDLRMPLIQHTLSTYILNVPAREISVGVYDFESREVVSNTFSDAAVAAAQRRFDQLITAMGF